MKRLIFLIILCFSETILTAQTNHEAEYDFYDYGTDVYNRNYDYESQYLKHKYELKAKNIKTTGWILSFATVAGLSFLASNYDWNLWIFIPCEVVGILALNGTMDTWAQKVKKKAQQINVDKVYEYNINDNYCISVCNHYDKITRRSTPGLGFNIRF